MAARIFFLVLALMTAPSLAAEENSGFGAALFSEQSHPAFSDQTDALDATEAATIEPAAGEELAPDKSAGDSAAISEPLTENQDDGSAVRGSNSQ